MEFFEFIPSYERKTNVMTPCRIPEFCERYEIDIGICDVKSKRILPRSVNQRTICFYIHKNHYCVIWKENRKDSLVNGVGEKEANFKFVKNKVSENKLSQRIP